ncbi:hypothetical protein L2E82_30526 [Cichorium intybus]|uniref:Uncharacterized protein n=1 Tax=Cichorium intybus TaxID=13427 RepID=A0ACB9D0G5_CICIN|nr:hypothetical protein L2E82_30526 [Cichorium intybus]
MLLPSHHLHHLTSPSSSFLQSMPSFASSPSSPGIVSPASSYLKDIGCADGLATICHYYPPFPQPEIIIGAWKYRPPPVPSQKSMGCYIGKETGVRIATIEEKISLIHAKYQATTMKEFETIALHEAMEKAISGSEGSWSGSSSHSVSALQKALATQAHFLMISWKLGFLL